MMASLVMATRGKPLAVWAGAAAAFLVHVVIATTIGVALFRVLPSRVLDAVVAVMFLAGGIYAPTSPRTTTPACRWRWARLRRSGPWPPWPSSAVRVSCGS